MLTLVTCRKFILAYNPQNTRAPPYYVYIGSANFSSAAWGQLDEDLKKNRATCNTKLIKTSNFECGVIIPGSLIEGLLEAGTESWQTGIVPHVQTTSRYDLSKDKAWNSMYYFHIHPGAGHKAGTDIADYECFTWS
jgi:phosphatidylserine/phosphatidylglycerophosphate/cardiolipin synthase-like enzyme